MFFFVFPPNKRRLPANNRNLARAPFKNVLNKYFELSRHCQLLQLNFAFQLQFLISFSTMNP